MIANGVYKNKRPNAWIWESRAFHEIEIYHQVRKWRENVSCEAKEKALKGIKVSSQIQMRER